MIKTPYNKIRETKGISYQMELNHIIKMGQRYKIHIDRYELNKKYNIKQYTKVSGK